MVGRVQTMDAIAKLFEQGGPVMWPLLACSIVSLTITIERLIFWRRENRREENPG